MTVAELITKLQEMPQDLPVIMFDDVYESYMEAGSVGILDISEPEIIENFAPQGTVTVLYNQKKAATRLAVQIQAEYSREKVLR